MCVTRVRTSTDFFLLSFSSRHCSAAHGCGRSLAPLAARARGPSSAGSGRGAVGRCGAAGGDGRSGQRGRGRGLSPGWGCGRWTVRPGKPPRAPARGFREKGRRKARDGTSPAGRRLHPSEEESGQAVRSGKGCGGRRAALPATGRAGEVCFAAGAAAREPGAGRRSRALFPGSLPAVPRRLGRAGAPGPAAGAASALRAGPGALGEAGASPRAAVPAPAGRAGGGPGEAVGGGRCPLGCGAGTEAVGEAKPSCCYFQ